MRESVAAEYGIQIDINGRCLFRFGAMMRGEAQVAMFPNMMNKRGADR